MNVIKLLSLLCYFQVVQCQDKKWFWSQNFKDKEIYLSIAWTRPARSWDDAFHICAKFDNRTGLLVRLDNPGFEAAILNYLTSKLFSSSAAVASENFARAFFIALRKPQNDVLHWWADEPLFPFNRSGKRISNPEESNRDCLLVLIKPKGFSYFYDWCNSTHHYVCERSVSRMSSENKTIFKPKIASTGQTERGTHPLTVLTTLVALILLILLLAAAIAYLLLIKNHQRKSFLRKRGMGRFGMNLHFKNEIDADHCCNSRTTTYTYAKMFPSTPKVHGSSTLRALGPSFISTAGIPLDVMSLPYERPAAKSDDNFAQKLSESSLPNVATTEFSRDASNKSAVENVFTVKRPNLGPFPGLNRLSETAQHSMKKRLSAANRRRRHAKRKISYFSADLKKTLIDRHLAKHAQPIDSQNTEQCSNI